MEGSIMTRQLGYALLLVWVAVSLAAWHGDAAAETEGKPRLPDAARDAELLYEKRLDELYDEFEAQKRQALNMHVERLIKLRKKYMSEEDHDSALAVRLRITELQDALSFEPVTRRPTKVGIPMDELRGTWMVTWSDHRRGPRRFHGRNRVTASGTGDGHLYRTRGGLIIKYPNRVIERITLGEDRLFFEHFNPGKTYPNGKARVLGIAAKLDR